MKQLNQAYLDKIDSLERAATTIQDLKSGKYIQDLEEKVRWYSGNLTSISKEEYEACQKWISEGKHFGHEYSYVFTPTQLGLVGEIICRCGESFEFRSI